MDWIGPKYREIPSTPHSEGDFADPKQLYCVCRQPYDPNDSRPEKVMFRCDGPCQKWVHPYCFGDTLE